MYKGYLESSKYFRLPAFFICGWSATLSKWVIPNSIAENCSWNEIKGKTLTEKSWVENRILVYSAWRVLEFISQNVEKKKEEKLSVHGNIISI